jgi:multiple sugar transport system ATP-binding protein
MADKILVMHGGEVKQIGDSLEFYDRPRHLFGASFIGSPAMSFLDGRIVRTPASGSRPRVGAICRSIR